MTSFRAPNSFDSSGGVRCPVGVREATRIILTALIASTHAFAGSTATTSISTRKAGLASRDTPRSVLAGSAALFGK